MRWVLVTAVAIPGIAFWLAFWYYLLDVPAWHLHSVMLALVIGFPSWWLTVRVHRVLSQSREAS